MSLQAGTESFAGSQCSPHLGRRVPAKVSIMACDDQSARWKTVMDGKYTSVWLGLLE